jgi:hypothetical protein
LNLIHISMQQTQFIIGLYKRKITVEDSAITSAVHLTLRQSLLPNALGRSPAIRPLESFPNLAANTVMFVLSHDSFFPLGIRIWIAGYPELALPNDLEHQCNRV